MSFCKVGTRRLCPEKRYSSILASSRSPNPLDWKWEKDRKGRQERKEILLRAWTELSRGKRESHPKQKPVSAESKSNKKGLEPGTPSSSYHAHPSQPIASVTAKRLTATTTSTTTATCSSPRILSFALDLNRITNYRRARTSFVIGSLLSRLLFLLPDPRLMPQKWFWKHWLFCQFQRLVVILRISLPSVQII